MTEKTISERFRDDDRGQLIIVAGIVVATTLVGLVFVLNGFLLTENLESQGLSSASDETVELNSITQEQYRVILDRTNYDESLDSDDFNTSSNKQSELLRYQYISQRGGSVVTTVDDFERGRVIRLPANTTSPNATNYTSQTGATAYNLVETGGVGGVRDFQLTVNSSELAETATPGSPPVDAFRVVAEPAGGANTVGDELWYLYVYKSSGKVYVASQEAQAANASGGGTVVDAISLDTPTIVYENSIATIDDSTNGGNEDGNATLSIDATEGTVQGWEAFKFAPNLDGDAKIIGFERADKVTGRFHLVTTGVTDPNPGDEIAASSPGVYEQDALYEVQIALRYRTPNFNYLSIINIKPDSLEDAPALTEPARDRTPKQGEAPEVYSPYYLPSTGDTAPSVDGGGGGGGGGANAPSVDAFDAVPGSGNKVDVNYDVSDPDGNLDQITLEVTYSRNGNTQTDTKTLNPSGGSASGTQSFNLGGSSTFQSASIEVIDSAGNSVSDTDNSL